MSEIHRGAGATFGHTDAAIHTYTICGVHACHRHHLAASGMQVLFDRSAIGRRQAPDSSEYWASQNASRGLGAGTEKSVGDSDHRPRDVGPADLAAEGCPASQDIRQA